MRLAIFLALTAPAAAAELPISGLAHVRFKVSDIEKARAFYSGVLGYEAAFEAKDAAGKVTVAYFKINDSQYVEIAPGLEEGEDERLDHVAFETPDLYKLRYALSAKGLPTSNPQTGPEGNRFVALQDPEGHRVLFVQYMPGSWHMSARGKKNGAGRISTHMMHTGFHTANEARALAFWTGKLGFTEFWRGAPEGQPTAYINLRTPGTRGDYIELMLYSAAPNRSQLGSMHHICLETASIEDTLKTALERGAPKDRSVPRVGRNRKRQLNLFDADGTRTELMEPKTVDQ